MRPARLLSIIVALALPAASRALELEFPARDSEALRTIPGELVSADFVHRSGQFRTNSGELMDFTLMPYGIVKHRGAESDLRDVPLGTKLDFLLLPDGEGRPTRLVTTSDGKPLDPEQQKKFRDFTEKRGVAGRIDKTEGKNVTVTFFSGDPAWFQTAWGELLAKGKEIKLCVANDELRTWNPGVDGERGTIVESEKLPVDQFYGSSGMRVTMTVTNMLEGFRYGRVVRVFLAGWKVQDQFYGESLMGYGFARMQNMELVENVAKEYADQFPFRTDSSNVHLPWYQLKTGVKPPPFSEHVVLGELVKADASAGTRQFRMDRSGEVVDFSLLPEAKVRYLKTDVTLGELPTGIRYRFHLYQDGKGAFTQARAISDEFSHQAGNVVTWRVDAVQLSENQLQVGWQIPEVKDYNGDMKRPPDFGRSVLRVSKDTRVWKGDSQVPLESLAVGDALLGNLSGELPGKPAVCTDLWIGEDTHKRVAEKQNQESKQRAKMKPPDGSKK